MFFLQATTNGFANIVGQYVYVASFGDSLFAALILFAFLGVMFWKLKIPLSVSAFLISGLVFSLGMPIPGYNNGIAVVGGIFSIMSFIIAFFGFIAVGFGLYYLFNRG